MLSFSPDLKTEKALKALHSKFVEQYQSIENITPDEAEYLSRWAFISNIGASTRIENAVLTDLEVEWVDTTLTHDAKTTAFDAQKEFILDKLSKDKERSIEEVAGCRTMLTTIYQQGKEFFPLTEATLRGLHHDLLQFYPKASYYAGKYKTSENKVVSEHHQTGQKKTVLEPAPPGLETEAAMTDLVAWYNQALPEQTWPILVASEFVFRFLAIHPFQDGNGRLGRGLFSLALLQADDKYLSTLVPFWAIDRHIEQNRPLYYSVLHKASGGKFYQDPGQYDYEPLVYFFINMIEASLADIDIYRERYKNLQELSENALAILQCFKAYPEVRLQVSAIEEDTSLPRRTVQYSLKTLVEKGFLQNLGQGAGSRYQLIF